MKNLKRKYFCFSTNSTSFANITDGHFWPFMPPVSSVNRRFITCSALRPTEGVGGEGKTTSFHILLDRRNGVQRRAFMGGVFSFK